MGRLIDADICLHEAWQNFYKQEDEHEKNIDDDYDILHDRFYEQSGFECCQQAIVNAPTVEAISKADYEARLKADIVAMLKEIKDEIFKESWRLECICDDLDGSVVDLDDINNIIQQKINKMREG